MKKILLLLFFIATNMGTIRLYAYCFYNYSDYKITIFLFSGTTGLFGGDPGFKVARYVLKPGDKRCRNWTTIDKKNRKKQWYWEAYKGDRKIRFVWSEGLGAGLFPIGGAVYYSGWYKDEFSISYDGKEWEWWKFPWKHKKQPWKTNK